MKITKKILIGLLALALIVPTVVISSLADDTAEDTVDVGALIELYEKETYYSDDYGASNLGAYSSDGLTADGAELTVIDNAGNNALKVEGGSVSLSADQTEASVGFVMAFAFRMASGTVEITVNGNNENGNLIGNVSLVTFTAADGAMALTLHQLGIYDTPSSFTPSVSLTADNWYAVTVIYHESTSSYEFLLTSGDDELYKAEIPTIVKDVCSIGMTASSDLIYLDDVLFYEGDTILDLTDIDGRTCAVLDRFIKIYESADSQDEEKQVAFDNIDLIINDSGYTAAGIYTDTVNKAYDIVARHYAAEFIDVVYSYSSADKYTARLASVESATAIKERTPDITGTTVDAVRYNRALALYEAAVIDVTTAKIDSDKFIAMLEDIDENSNDYYEVSELIEAVSNLSYDITYPDIADEYAKYEKMVANFEALDAKAKAYISVIENLKKEDESFAVRYEYYVQAGAFYFLGAKYPGLDEAIAYYDFVADSFAEISSYNDEFLVYVSSAKATNSLSVRNAYLDTAKKYIEDHENDVKTLQLDYKNVKEAIDDYKAMREQIVVDTENAEKFIAVVDKLYGVKDFYQRKAIVEEASTVKPDIAIDGIAGYAAAYSEYEATRTTILFTEGYANQFMDIVSSIDEAVTLPERYELIVQALQYVDGGVSDEVKGVGGMKAMLQNYIDSYNSDVTDSNAEFCGVVSESAGIAALAAPTESYTRTVAVIKKYFE